VTEASTAKVEPYFIHNKRFVYGFSCKIMLFRVTVIWFCTACISVTNGARKLKFGTLAVIYAY